MTSDSQILANQMNSQLSTGPNTPEGKRQSSLNSLTHGFAGRTIVVSDEDRDAYQALCRTYFDEFQPVGANETGLVQQLADLRFALQQMLDLERQFLSLAKTLDPAALTALNNTSIYYNRKHRAAESTLRQLREVQSARKAIEKEQLVQAAAIQKMQDSRDEPFDPSEIGFACSAAQIETYMRLDDLRRAVNSPALARQLPRRTLT